MENKSPAKGIISALISFFFLSLIAVFVKLAGEQGAKLGWIVFIQYTVAFSLALVISSREKFRNLKTEKLRFEIMRGGAGVASFLCFVLAMAEIPLVDASLLQNTAPIFIPIIGLIWLRENVEKRIWTGIIIGFVGIILIIKPDSGLFKTGDLLGLASGILLALGYVAMKIITKTDSFKTVFFYFTATAFVLSVPLGIIYWSNPGITGWLYTAATGVLLTGYLNLLQFAYQHVEPAKVSPFNYSVVVFLGLLDWWLFGHVPGLLTIIGIVIVCLGGILVIIHHEKGNKELNHSWH